MPRLPSIGHRSCVDPASQLIDVVHKTAADFADQIRQIGVLLLNETFKSAQITNSLWRDVAEFIVVRTQCVDQLSAVIDQLFSRAKHYRPKLLLLGFDFDEAHRWPLRCLDDRLRIRCVVLLPLDERLDIPRCNQLRLMPS